MVTRVTLHHDGEPTVEQLPSTGGVSSSANAPSSGVQVSRGMGKISVFSPDDLLPNDLVTVQGMTLTAENARNMDLMDQVFSNPTRTPEQLDPSLSTSAAYGAAEANRSNTGVPSYDASVDGLSAAVADGTMEAAEATEFETALGSIAMTGLSLDHAREALDAVASGDLDEADIPVNVRQSLNKAETRITEVSEQSAKRELGDAEYGWLQQAAAVHPGVSRVVREFALDRATGKAPDLTWSDLAQHIREQMS